MKNNILKVAVTSLLLAAGLVSLVQGASTSVTVASGVMTSFPNVNAGPIKVTQIILTSSGTNNAAIQLIDTYTNWTKYTNSAYTNILSYSTNYVSTWTNYYGATNSTTNISLVDVTNAVAATVNSFNVAVSLAAPTNSSVRVDSVNYYFANGIWVTNTGTGSSTVTITYQQ